MQGKQTATTAQIQLLRAVGAPIHNRQDTKLPAIDWIPLSPQIESLAWLMDDWLIAHSVAACKHASQLHIEVPV